MLENCWRAIRSRRERGEKTSVVVRAKAARIAGGGVAGKAKDKKNLASSSTRAAVKAHFLENGSYGREMVLREQGIDAVSDLQEGEVVERAVREHARGLPVPGDGELLALLERAQPSPALPCSVRRPLFVQSEIAHARDYGVVLLASASHDYEVSARTFVLSSAILDKYLSSAVDAGSFSSGQMVAISLACFIMASKLVETYAISIRQVVGMVNHRCTMQDVCDAEHAVLEALDWDIDIVTSLDILEKLLSMAHPAHASTIAASAQQNIKIACCISDLARASPSDTAVGVLLQSCQQQQLGEGVLDFVPAPMLTNGAREWGNRLDIFLRGLSCPSISSLPRHGICPFLSCEPALKERFFYLIRTAPPRTR